MDEMNELQEHHEAFQEEPVSYDHYEQLLRQGQPLETVQQMQVDPDERIFGRPFYRPFYGYPRPFYRPFFGGPFLGGVVGGLLGSALLHPYY